MIDLHCHILPGLDDGPATMDESVEMCRIAAADGIMTIVSSPHFRPGKYDYTPERMRELLGDPIRAAAMGAAGREHVTARQGVAETYAAALLARRILR